MTTITSFPLTTVALTDLAFVRSAGYAYTWSTAITSTDPGAGVINADNATFASITALYLSETDADDNDLSSVLATWDDSTSAIKGELRIYNPLTPGNIMTFSVTARTDNGTYDTLTVTPLSSNGSFSADDELRLEFRAKGDAGDATDFSTTTHAATSKTTPVDADELPIVDSAASNVLKKLTWANLKATLKTYFDSLTQTLTNKDLSSATNTFPTFNQNTTGSAAKLTTARTIDGQSFDGSANITVIAPGTHAATSKTTPVDADEFALVDSAASNVLKKLTWANLKSALPASSSGLPLKYWAGFAHSNNVTTPNTKIDIGAGVARDSTDAFDIQFSSTTVNCGTTGANGLDTGSLANSTHYYTFAIAKSDGTSASLASTSSTAPTLPTGYTYFRRIGSFRTDSSAHILAFHHVNDRWYYDTTIRDVNDTAVGTTFLNKTLSVPAVQGVVALYAATWFASSTITAFIMPVFLPDTAANGFALNIAATGGGEMQFQTQVDSSGRVKVKSSAASTTVVIDTAGWIDPL